MQNITQNTNNTSMPNLEEWNKFKHDYALLKTEIEKTKKQLEKYTNNERHKKYYQQNKERIKENAKVYLNRLKVENPEKLKEYRHKAYLKRKSEKKDENVLSNSK
jgi:hypothetical protein